MTLIHASSKSLGNLVASSSMLQRSQIDDRFTKTSNNHGTLQKGVKQTKNNENAQNQ